MSKSLNQAFIKAYSKEQAGLAKQLVSEKSSTSQVEDFRIEDFIVRFDTATCVIPTHHAAVGQKPKIAAANLISLPLPTVAPTAPPTTPPTALRSSALRPTPVAMAPAAAMPTPKPTQMPTPMTKPMTKPTPTAMQTAMPMTNSTSTSGATVLNLSRRDRSQTTQSRPVVSHREQELAAERQAAEDLRNTIASQMSRAGNWEAQQIDAFHGGFPMVSQFHQRRGPGSTSQSPASQGKTGQGKTSPSSQLQGPHFGKVGVGEPSGTLVSRSEMRLNEALVSRSETRLRETLVSRSETRQKETGLSGEHAEEAPRMSPLESPALFPPAVEAPQAVRDQHAALAAQLNREARVEDCGGGGEIFRLDRPTYQQRPDGTGRNEYADSGDLSSEVLGLSESGTNVDLEALDSRIEGHQRATSTAHHRVDVPERGRVSRQEPASQRTPRVDAMAANNVNSNTARSSINARAASESATSPAAANSSRRRRDWPAKSLEQDLRKAKARIFNPVWEVDNFQWPDICIELLQQRAEAMEAVARNLIEACQEGLQVLAVTSPQSGEGRTTVACCLAKLAGSRGLNVAIVDGDIENPTLSVQTNLELEQDWKTAIFNQLPLEEVAVHSIEDQVTLVPLVHPINHDEMAIDDNRIEFMLQELSASFDLVIVDMGHMGSSRSLVTSLGERGVISAVVAVVDYRSSTRQQVDQCLQRIRQTGVASIGLVENFAA